MASKLKRPLFFIFLATPIFSHASEVNMPGPRGPRGPHGSTGPQIIGAPVARHEQIDKVRESLTCLNFFAEIANTGKWKPDKTSVMADKFPSDTYKLYASQALLKTFERAVMAKTSPEMGHLQGSLNHQLQFIYKKPKDVMFGEAVCDLLLFELGISKKEDYNKARLDPNFFKTSSK